MLELGFVVVALILVPARVMFSLLMLILVEQD